MTKTSEGHGIPAELFQILDDSVKVLHLLMPANLVNSRTKKGHRTGKGQFSFQSQRKARPKNVQTTTQFHSSHTLATSISALLTLPNPLTVWITTNCGKFLNRYEYQTT